MVLIMLRHKVFISGAGALFVGIATVVFMPMVAWFVFGIVTIMVLFGVLGVARMRSALIAIVVIVCSAIGIVCGKNAVMWAHAPYDNADNTVQIIGIVLQDPVQKTFQQQTILAVRSCTMENGATCAIDRLLLRTQRYAEGLSMRRSVRVTCVLTPIENFSKTFDYVMYLAAKGVRYACDAEDVVIAKETGIYDQAYRVLADLRMRMESIIMRNVVQPQGALAAGLLFGGDERLSQSWQDKFSATGLTHIVAVSGYNVTVIAHALILFGIFIGLWRKHATWFAIGGVILFVAMIGAPAAAVRAGIMGVIVLFLLASGRMGSALPVLFLTGTIMATINPLIVRYDIGFQLSFLATLGIIIVYPVVERFVRQRNHTLGIVEIILVTVSAQVFVVPVIAYHFQTFAPYSLLANILVLPLIPIVMAVTVVMVIGGFMSTWFAMWSGWVVSILLSWVFIIVDFFAKAPYASLHVERFSLWWIAAWYGIVGGILVYGRKHVIRCNHR